MADNKVARADLLESIEEGVALLKHFHSSVNSMDDVSASLSRKLQVELAKHTGALTEQFIRLKYPREHIDARLPAWDHWVGVLWTIDDAVQLAANQEPIPNITWGDDLVPLHLQLEKAVHDKRLASRFSASEFLNWFDQIGDENTIVPTALRKVVARAEHFSHRADLGRPLSDNGEASARASSSQSLPKDSLDARERNSLYQLLVYFMRQSAGVTITQTNEKPWGHVRDSDARRLASSLLGKIGFEAIFRNVNLALEWVGRSEQEGVNRKPKRGKKIT